MPKKVRGLPEASFILMSINNFMERIITYAEAIREATEQAMARDPAVILFGLGVDDVKGFLGTTKGLQEKFGNMRVFDTPLSEDGMTGVAIGAALSGLRPIHTHVRVDFLMLAMNQLVNIAAKARYMYGGAVSVPLVVRALIGDGWGAQHSQGLHSFFMHVPGLKVVAPSTPYVAKGCLLEAIRDNNPVLFIEQFKLYSGKGHVPKNLYHISPGKASIVRHGKDITLVGISSMVVECLRAAAYLEKLGLSTEVIDPMWLSPLDSKTIIVSAKKTGRLLVVDTAWTMCGASAEILARVAEDPNASKIKMKRLGFAPVPCPTTTPLEKAFYPNARTIAREAWRLIYGNKRKMPALVIGDAEKSATVRV